MHAAVLATLPDTSARAYTLTVGGSDMNVTGQSPAAYKVPIESIQITEEGPGGVSGMDFDIWDPDREVVLTEMARVEFWDVTNSLPLFAGFVQSWGVSGIIGRTLAVHCIGIEAVLDWMLIPAEMTFADGSRTNAAIQALYANATGIGVPLRAFTTDTGTLASGNQALPIGDLDLISGGYAHIVGPITVTATSTLRDAITFVMENSETSVNDRLIGAVTVDFWTGLRVWLREGVIFGTSYGPIPPSDYIDLTVADNPSGAFLAATQLDHDTDAAGVPRGVFIQGGNAAGTGLVSDGTGIPGPIASLSDSLILTAAARDRAGTAYLADKGLAIRGSFTLENFASTTNRRAGSPLTLSSTAAGLAGFQSTIVSISKRFIAARQTWTVAYGGLRPSAIRQLRRFTRAVRS